MTLLRRRIAVRKETHVQARIPAEDVERLVPIIPGTEVDARARTSITGENAENSVQRTNTVSSPGVRAFFS